MAEAPRRNRLVEETSPYLLQHADNPVDWLPWGDEAFARARAEDKPVFLSIGYSTCHWCHVMAHESFENPGVAAVLNAHFVPIKVDREERPDIDRVYMTYVQATTGHGGWPMSVWLTPDRTPFYGGTYFPPEDRWGRPGFVSILHALARIWREDRPRVLQQGAHAIQALQQFAGRSVAGERGLDPAALEGALEFFSENFDEQWGGFGDAPKFPRPAVLHFLWRAHAAARRLAEVTLRKMIAGGIHDHIGGGFHRYSVDATWHIPHFEKMLYDQGQIVCALVEAWQATGDDVFADAARDTLTYVRRNLAAPGGAFFSAEDADSLRPGASGHEHGEGAFYVWSADEIRRALGPERAPLFCAHYGVKEQGNAPDGADPHGEFTGLNTLIERRSVAESAATAGIDIPGTARVLAECRAALFAVREQRPRPQRDEKILTAWNGLMLSGCARAGAAFEDATVLDAAAGAARFIRENLWVSASGTLRRSLARGRAGAEGFAEDYAFLAQGLLDLYEATFEVQWLQWAIEVQDAMDRLFIDPDAGGYFSSSGRDPSVLLRMKEDHDGAEPAPSSVAAMNLLRLGRMLGDEARTTRARRTLEAFSGIWERAPQSLPCMLAALSDWLRPPRQIVLAGTPGSADFAALAREVRRRLLPGVVVLAADGGAGQAWLAERAPWLREMRPIDGRAAAYVCENFTCRLPVVESAELGALLDRLETAT